MTHPLTSRSFNWTNLTRSAIKGVTVSTTRRRAGKADSEIGRLLDKVDQRRRMFPQEDWLVLVGYWGKAAAAASGLGKEYLHRQQQAVESGTDRAEHSCGDTWARRPVRASAQTSVAPTVLRHMGLKLQPEWLLDGTPLLGDTGVRKARADENKDGYAGTVTPRVI